MLQYGYKEIDERKAEHQQLIENARALQNKLHKQSKTISEEEIEFLEHWLTGHILAR